MCIRDRTTGFATVDFNQWPMFSKTILVILMIFGACAGSTGGGIKSVSYTHLWIAAGLAVVAAGVVFLRMTKRGKAFFAALGAKLFRRLSRAVDSRCV